MLKRVINLDDLVGIRYKENGRDSNGYDCYGYAMEVEMRFGHVLPEIRPDAKDNKEKVLREVLSRINVESSLRLEEPGDIILINDSKGVFSHIGVYLGDGLFTHCNYLGVHIDRVAAYQHKIGKVYRWL